jgi:O-antigen/teichoic acid export membrane protein
LLLAAFGIDDYGLYNLVGGVVGLFASLKVMFAFSVQRFLSFAKGQNDKEHENIVFNVSLFLHIGIALFFFLLVEVFGCWFIPNKLNIAPESMSNAMYVFHYSVITSAIAIIVTPYSAALMANEKMDVYSYLSILDAFLRLVVILVLPYLPYIPIKAYPVFLLGIELLNFTVYYLSCRKLPECRITGKVNKESFKEIGSFAGWDFMGNTAWALINEGVNMILNIFGGVAINAARGVAYQVKNAVIQLTNNVMVASRPQIIQQAAYVEKSNVFGKINLTARMLFLVMVITVLPIIMYAKQILEIWLVETPDYAVSFVQLTLVWCVIRTMNTPVDLAFTAYGEMKYYQIFNTIALLLNLPIAYLLLKNGYSYIFAFITFCVVEVIDIIVNLIVARRRIDFDVALYLKKVVLPNIFDSIILGVLAFFCICYFNVEGVWHTLFAVAIVLILSVFIVFFFFLTREEKIFFLPLIKSFVKNKLNK